MHAAALVRHNAGMLKMSFENAGIGVPSASAKTNEMSELVSLQVATGVDSLAICRSNLDKSAPDSESQHSGKHHGKKHCPICAGLAPVVAISPPDGLLIALLDLPSQMFELDLDQRHAVFARIRPSCRGPPQAV